MCFIERNTCVMNLFFDDILIHGNILKITFSKYLRIYAITTRCPLTLSQEVAENFIAYISISDQ